ncbi:DNA topoisomerase IB [Microbacterium sp. 10M-3C3]|uniref:DNA topoisomerase IB n=1 Tax=Microbacterium sp. 10M-3C3 TaxID=2483401 RepID=UPI0013DD9E57|nr:DNA topoisomerase IB [Microbacterium sp. 10M-3C3]
MSDPVPLRHVPRPPGLHRLAGGGWVADDGTPVSSRADLARLSALRIPPAWTHVWSSPDAEAPLQATGIDARGRTQYRYSAEAVARAAADKFAHLGDFARALPRVRAQADADLRTRAPRVGVLTATAVRLLERGLFRVGNDRYARDNHTFGLTTLTRAHVAVAGADVAFDFVGKEHIRHRITVTDPVVARVLRRRLGEPGAPEDPLFVAADPPHVHRVDSATVNAYLHAHAGVGATAKAFRTWGATIVAMALAAGADLPALAGRRIRPDLRPIHGAAFLLGDTPAVARASYVHPRALAVADGSDVRVAVATAVERAGSDDVRRILHDDGLHAAAVAVLYP